MAESVRDLLDQTKPTVDEKTRLRVLKERQNEERQRKLEEIKAQALAAQRFKEQKEQERRKRLEELRVKDEAKRQQVEERKKAINDAEKHRLEFILKKNQEREQRLDLKKRNERSNPVFAFGSSTPRMLEPVDLTVSFWGHRKATSIQNISSSASASSSLTRRQSERDLDVANKKRATSATGLERSAENNIPSVPAGCASGYLGRRRTDLVPTIPTRDSSFTSSRKSLNHSPGRAYSMTRLDQLAKPRRRPDLPSLDESHSFNSRPLSSSRVSSVTRSMSHLAVGKLKPSPTTKGLDKADSRSMHQLAGDGAHLAPRTTRTTQLREQKLHASSNHIDASSRPSSSLSQQSTNSVTSATSVRHRISATPRKPRPVSIAVTGITYDVKFEKRNEMKPPLPKARKSINKDVAALKSKIKSPIEHKKEVVEIKKEVVNDKQVIHETQKIAEVTEEVQKKPPDVNSVKTQSQASIAETSEFLKSEKKSNEEHVPESKPSDIEVLSENAKKDESQPKVNEPEKVEVKVEPVPETKKEVETKQQPTEKPVEPVEPKPIAKVPADVSSENKESNINTEMTASMIKRINTEEEAKAAIAEKRRLIREEAERQAELERLRLEEEARAELERQQKEEEQVRQLIEIQRQAEQERLKEAIKEAQRREEEERLKKEEEQKMKQLKEEAERKAREDAERQKAELQERLKNEEKEREARRKRVEAIMLRTRGKNNANLSTQSTDEKNENKADDQGRDDQENKVNGTKIIDRENGMTKNGKETEIVDNIIQSEIVKNANSIDTISSTDTLNSNNSWRESQQFDSLM